MDNRVPIPDNVQQVIRDLHRINARSIVVGGFVRDWFLNMKSKDLDIEVFNISTEDLKSVLKRYGTLSIVGAQFSILSLRFPDGTVVDFSQPRRENKTGRLHTDFDIETDGSMTFEEAAKRRDFTINAIGYDPISGDILDPFSGVADLNCQTLRMVSDQFGDDALRVLRGMQFAARFGFKVSPGTAIKCAYLISEYHTIALERVFIEFDKLFRYGNIPSYGIQFLIDTGWIQLFPEIRDMMGVGQDAEWHPEGDVLTHTKMVMDEAAVIAVRNGLDEDQRAQLVLAALCHDMGKVTTTEVVDGRIVSRRHDIEGEWPTRSFCNSIGVSNKETELVVSLVRCHMRHIRFMGSETQVKRLAHAVNIKMLSCLVEADHSGRSPLPKHCPPEMLEILRIAQELKIESEKPKDIVRGRDLIAWGFPTGKLYKVILDDCREAQIEGIITDIDSAQTFVLAKYGHYREASLRRRED